MTTKIKVHFTHPREGGRSFAVEVSPQCTGKQAIEGLLIGGEEGPFLEAVPTARPFELTVMRTGEAITSSMTFEGAGVEDGDIIEVRQAGQGGGPDWAELGHMLFWSVAAASIFIKAARPVLLEFLKNKRSRSIIIRTGKSEIVLSGDDPEKVLEVLKLIENKSINDTLAGDTSSPSQDSTIQLILRDAEGRDSE